MVNYLLVCAAMLLLFLIFTVVALYRMERSQTKEWQDLREDLIGDLPTQQLVRRKTPPATLRRRHA